VASARACGVIACIGLTVLVADVAPAMAARQSYEPGAAIAGPAAAPFETPFGVAVDNSTGPSAGDLYVTDVGAYRVDKLGPTGNFILAFGKGVDATTGGDVCTAASGDTCQAGATGFSPGELPAPDFVAVDPSSGDVYVGDNYAGVQKYTSSGELITSWGEGGQIDQIATESLISRVYGVTVSDSGRMAMMANTIYTGSRVYLFSPEGALLNNFTAFGGASYKGGITTDGGARFFKGNADEESYEEIAGGSDAGQVSQSGSHGFADTANGATYYPAGDDLFISDGGSVTRYLFANDNTVIEAQGGGGVECTVPPRPGYGEAGGCGPTERLGSGTFTETRGIATAAATGKVYVIEGGTKEIDTLEPVALPEARTEAPTEVTRTSMRLEGSLDPLAGPVFSECHFEYGTTTAYASGSVPCAPAGPFAGVTTVSAPIAGLSPETTYHYRLVASDGTHTYTGYDLTTSSGPVAAPVVVSSSAGVPDPTHAVLSALIAPGANPFTVRFEYGPTTEYGSRTFPQGPLAPNPDGSPVAVGATLSGLLPEATYHYRVMATNFGGTTLSADGTFETGGGVATSSPAKAATTAPAAPAKPAPAKCKKGFAKRGGKCVKPKSHKPKKHKSKPKKKHKRRGHGDRKGNDR
jgi:hypothetical protein